MEQCITCIYPKCNILSNVINSQPLYIAKVVNRKKKEKEKPPRAGYEYNFKWNCSERQPFC